jgi:3-deoxy-manno-octulosonate cytidylyltransferase (CMP-KDO synthetase)
MGYYPLKLQKESNMIATKDGGIQSMADKKPKIIGVIPARYASSRFPGKPLADIHGKPMIWWVYQQAKKVTEFSEVYVATDDERIAAAVKAFGGYAAMTSGKHPNHISRIHEVSEKIAADFYVCINGDEPLVSRDSISAVLKGTRAADEPYFRGAMRSLSNPSETLDTAKIKLAVSADGRCVYMSRIPIPYPQGTLLFDYKKYMGIEAFNKAALDFFVNTPMGRLEKIEDIDHLRFLENNVPLYFVDVESDSISVDTPKDLEYVSAVINKRTQGEKFENQYS